MILFPILTVLLFIFSVLHKFNMYFSYFNICNSTRFLLKFGRIYMNYRKIDMNYKKELHILPAKPINAGTVLKMCIVIALPG